MAIVYWIHLEKHKDFKSMGYIGYSNRDLETRLSEHLIEAKDQNKRKTILHKAINKYGEGNLIAEVLLEGSPEYCLMMEERLRPDEKIGWNIVKGGGAPPSQDGKKHSDERKKKASLRLKGKTPINHELMQARSLEVRSKIGTWQRTSCQNKRAVWSKADLIYTYLNGVEGRQNFQELSEFLGFDDVESVRKIASYIKQRDYNPFKCSNWLRDFSINSDNVQELINNHVDPSFGQTQDVVTKELRAKSLRLTSYNKSRHWAFALLIYEKMMSGVRRCDISKEMGFTKNNLTEMYKRFRNGWNPNEDQEYLSWLKERTENDST